MDRLELEGWRIRYCINIHVGGLERGSLVVCRLYVGWKLGSVEYGGSIEI